MQNLSNVAQFADEVIPDDPRRLRLSRALAAIRYGSWALQRRCSEEVSECQTEEMLPNCLQSGPVDSELMDWGPNRRCRF